VLNAEGRIVSTREPRATRGPLFSLIRSTGRCVWAIRDDVPRQIAFALEDLAQQESPPLDLQNPPLYAGRYLSLLGSWREREFAGPAFIFPDSLVQPDDIAVLDDERRLHQHFQGWTTGEIAAGRAPVMAIIRDGWPVSICFSARSSDVAAEAGVETAEAFRGHGFAARVTAAWALSIRASGRIPLYSTSWTNTASLAVARKLNLKPYASGWSVL
jgi:hypothetical protein